MRFVLVGFGLGSGGQSCFLLDVLRQVGARDLAEDVAGGAHLVRGRARARAGLGLGLGVEGEGEVASRTSP